MNTPPMLRQLRHDVWATGRLLERCRALNEGQLDLTAPGTYGTIRRTLAHIVRADEGYLHGFGLTHEPLLEVTDTVTLDQIEERLTNVREAVEGLFGARDLDFDRRMRDERRKTDLDPWVLVTQFAHHGSDHRSQINTILSVHGLEAPDLDVWAYAGEEHAVVRS